ncbi:hypothetical protein RCL_jg12045.t1 [Rhizophagus clarus]|uniref:Uncharacterized protein n=1 Tax=Rhizophagus clarus TaxID=94130 RepID=A0A8H3QIY7_9GLOM|nr:hypothetical protein RCL_jg12045.t1 [Rhizophagus clarus]
MGDQFSRSVLCLDDFEGFNISFTKEGMALLSTVKVDPGRWEPTDEVPSEWSNPGSITEGLYWSVRSLLLPWCIPPELFA